MSGLEAILKNKDAEIKQHKALIKQLKEREADLTKVCILCLLTLITHCLLGNLFMLFWRLLIFFKFNFSKNLFQAYHQSVKQFGSR